MRMFIIICQDLVEWVPVEEPLPPLEPIVEYGTRWFQAESPYYTKGEAYRLIRLMHQRLKKSYPDLDRSTVNYVCYELGAAAHGWLKYCWETTYAYARYNVS
jgi:hypothetical protein